MRGCGYGWSEETGEVVEEQTEVDIAIAGTVREAEMCREEEAGKEGSGYCYGGFVHMVGVSEMLD